MKKRCDLFLDWIHDCAGMTTESWSVNRESAFSSINTHIDNRSLI